MENDKTCSLSTVVEASHSPTLRQQNDTHEHLTAMLSETSMSSMFSTPFNIRLTLPPISFDILLTGMNVLWLTWLLVEMLGCQKHSELLSSQSVGFNDDFDVDYDGNDNDDCDEKPDECSTTEKCPTLEESHHPRELPIYSSLD